MKKLLLIAVVIALAWHWHQQYEQRKVERALAKSKPAATQRLASAGASFQCDGRAYCSQMTSCAEATFFIRNCPGTKMDGDNDGVPCESQWCN